MNATEAMEALTALREENARLEARCDRLWAMIAGMDQGVAFIDATGKVAEINSRYLEFLGRQAAEILSRSQAALRLDTGEHQLSAFLDLYARGAVTQPVAVNQRLGETDVTVRLQPVLENGRFGGVIINVIDVTALVEARHSVEREKSFLEQVINIAGAAICLVSPEDVVVNVNAEFIRLTGHARDQAMGRDRRELLGEGPDDPSPADTADRRQSQITTADGRRLTILKNTAPLLDASGQVVGGIESFVDVTELIAARLKAEEASRMKSVFLANMSHEIRTPLNALLGIPQLLDKTPLTPEQREYLATMRSAGESLLAIVSDILDFSKIEAGRMEIDPHPVSLPRLLSDIRLVVAQAAREKGLDLRIAAGPDTPDLVVTDGPRLKQVLLNLLSNAIKFTEKGRVELSVSRLATPASRDGGDTVRLRFEVADTGVGVPGAQLGRIFEPFVQADGSVARHHGGTGLGLSISRRLVELLGGSCIEVKSELGQGSAFSFSLDLAPSASLEAPSPSGAAGPPRLDNLDFGALRVLVAEDNAFNRFLLKKVLEQIGVGEVLFADNGRDAVSLALERAGTPRAVSLVFMDLRMPVMDGFEAARAIRRAGLTMPIAALTAQAMSEDADKCRQAGMTHYLSKPYRIRDLEAILAGLAGAKGRDAP